LLRIVLHPDASAIPYIIASSYGIYYTFQVAIPVIYTELHRYNQLQVGLVFLPSLAGMTIAGKIASKLIDANYRTEAREQNIHISHKEKVNRIQFPIEHAR
jgi:hypothetical protein